MKKLTLILAVVFTLGLGASTVSASTKDKTKKEQTECAKAKECPKDAKACCASKTVEKPAEKK